MDAQEDGQQTRAPSMFGGRGAGGTCSEEEERRVEEEVQLYPGVQRMWQLSRDQKKAREGAVRSLDLLEACAAPAHGAENVASGAGTVGHELGDGSSPVSHKLCDQGQAAQPSGPPLVICPSSVSHAQEPGGLQLAAVQPASPSYLAGEVM